MNSVPPETWDRIKAGDAAARSLAVEAHWPLVRSIAKDYARQSSGIDKNDAAGYGVIGLMQAVDRYDPSVGTTFPEYAGRRIKGAIIDGLRSEMWVKRPGAKKAKAADRPTRMPTMSQIAGRTHSKTALHEALDRDHCQAGGTPWRVSDPGGPCDRAERESEWARLLRPLPTARHRLVVREYVEGGRLMKEIGADLGVSESMVSKLYAEACRILKATSLAGARSAQLLAEWKAGAAA